MTATTLERRAHRAAQGSQPPTLKRGSDGRLCECGDGRSRPVTVTRCFPWSKPAQYLSLRDDEGKEVALVQNADELDPSSRAALMDALAEAGFILEVTAITSIDEEVEIRSWQVQTKQGVRTLQTRLDEWPLVLPGGGYLVQDVAGDLYRVPEVELLDAESQNVFWPYID